MKTKPFTFLLALTFLFLFSGSSIVIADDWEDAGNAFLKKDYKTAHKLLKQLAEKGIAEAQLMFAEMYSEGLGVPQDYKEAVKWTKLAAEQGYDLAQNKLGVMYDRGQKVPQDYKEAARFKNICANT